MATASVNMWALLADEDPGDSPMVKRDEISSAADKQPVAAVDGKSKKKKTKKTKKQAKASASVAPVANGEIVAAVSDGKGKVQSSLAGVQKPNEKKTKAAAASAVQNGGAQKQSSGPRNGRKEAPSKQQQRKEIMYQSESEADDDEEEEEEVRGGSFVRGLFVGVVTTALVAFSLHVSVAAAAF